MDTRLDRRLVWTSGNQWVRCDWQLSVAWLSGVSTPHLLVGHKKNLSQMATAPHTLVPDCGHMEQVRSQPAS